MLPHPVTPRLVAAIQARCDLGGETLRAASENKDSTWFYDAFTPLRTACQSAADGPKQLVHYDVRPDGTFIINSTGPFCLLTDDWETVSAHHNLKGADGFVEILMHNGTGTGMRFIYTVGAPADYIDVGVGVDITSVNPRAAEAVGLASSDYRTQPDYQIAIAKMLSCTSGGRGAALGKANMYAKDHAFHTALSLLDDVSKRIVDPDRIKRYEALADLALVLGDHATETLVFNGEDGVQKWARVRTTCDDSTQVDIVVQCNCLEVPPDVYVEFNERVDSNVLNVPAGIDGEAAATITRIITYRNNILASCNAVDIAAADVVEKRLAFEGTAAVHLQISDVGKTVEAILDFVDNPAEPHENPNTIKVGRGHQPKVNLLHYLMGKRDNNNIRQKATLFTDVPADFRSLTDNEYGAVTTWYMALHTKSPGAAAALFANPSVNIAYTGIEFTVTMDACRGEQRTITVTNADFDDSMSVIFPATVIPVVKKWASAAKGLVTLTARHIAPPLSPPAAKRPRGDTPLPLAPQHGFKVGDVVEIAGGKFRNNVAKIISIDTKRHTSLCVRVYNNGKDLPTPWYNETTVTPLSGKKKKDALTMIAARDTAAQEPAPALAAAEVPAPASAGALFLSPYHRYVICVNPIKGIAPVGYEPPTGVRASFHSFFSLSTINPYTGPTKSRGEETFFTTGTDAGAFTISCEHSKLSGWKMKPHHLINRAICEYLLVDAIDK